MKATYNLDIDDLMIFQQYHLSNSKVFLKSKFSGIFIFVILLIVIYLINPQISSDLPTLFVIIGSGITGLIIGYIKHDKVLLKNIRKNFEKENMQTFLGEFSILINNDYFIISHNGNEGETLWSSLVKIEENKDYIYLYQTTNCAIILPKNKISITDGGSKEEFFTLIQHNQK